MLYATLLSTRAVNIISGLLCLIIVAGTYDSFAAGRIYTLLSLCGAATLFELGLSTLVLQRATQLTQKEGWRQLDSTQSYTLITPFFGHYLVLISAQALLLLIVLLPVGLWIIVEVFKEPLVSLGVFAWVGTCLVMALGLPTVLLLSIMEGLGQLAFVARVRALQALASLLSLNLALFMGAGYPAVAIQLFCALIVGWLALWVFHGSFIKHILRNLRLRLVKARVNLDWPFQWRLSLSFLSGYFSNQAWVVAISLTGSVALAGSVAMTLQILTAMVGFAMTPIAARFATLGALARPESASDFHKLAYLLIRQTGWLFLMMLGFSVIGYVSADFFIPAIKSKILPTLPLIVMVICTPLALAFAVLTLLNQSLGRDDLYLVSVFRIIAPLSVLAILGNGVSAWSFSLSFAFIILLSVLAGFKIYLSSLTRHLA